MATAPVIKIVSSVEELIYALKTASGGEAILLADGNYGSVTLDSGYGNTLERYSETVTIAAMNPGKAVFDALDIQRASHLALEGLTATSSIKIQYDSNDVAIRNTQAKSVILRDISGLELVDNDIGGGRYGLVLHSVSNGAVSNNYIHEVTEDLVRVIGDSHDLLIENNVISDTIAKSPTHPDLIQMYGYAGKNPHDVTLRGNLLYDDTTTGSVGAQGIFMTDPQGLGYRNILVEQNLISVQHTNTITISGGEENVVIQDNSLLATKYSSGGLIRVIGKAGFGNDGVSIDHNIIRTIYDPGRSAIIGDNYKFGVGTLNKALNDQSDIYQSPKFIGWESFLPVVGSGIDFGKGYGAEARLADLLAGVNAHAGVIRLAYEQTAVQNFSGNSNSYTAYAHNDALLLDEGTLSLDFTVTSASGQRGIISKNSAGLSDGFYAYVDNGQLVVAFEDDQGTQTVTHSGIDTGDSYNLAISFDGNNGRVWLDGELVGDVSTAMDWTSNKDNLILGAISQNNEEGSVSNLKYFGKGTASELRIYDTALSIKDLQLLEDKHDAYVGAATKTPDWSKVAIYEAGEISFSRLSDRMVFDAADLALDEATVILNFNSNLTSWYKGLLAKNSAGLDNGFDIYIYNGKLDIRFEDNDGTKTLSAPVSRLTDYELMVSFGDGKAEAWLDGKSIGSVETDMTWEQSSDNLVLGALNTNAKPGTLSGLANPFNGDINGFLVLNEGMTAAEAAAYVDANPYLII